jgi:hypothetical protein
VIDAPSEKPWHADAEGFVALVGRHPDVWPQRENLKYLNLRIDTRDGHYQLDDRYGRTLDPQPVIEALLRKEALERKTFKVSPEVAQFAGQHSIDDLIECAERELKLRREVYQRRMASGSMTQALATREIARMSTIASVLHAIRDTMPPVQGGLGV